MPIVSRRSVVGGSIALVAASEIEATAPAQAEIGPPGPTDPNLEPSFVFENPVTAICSHGAYLAIATGTQVFIVKVR